MVKTRQEDAAEWVVSVWREKDVVDNKRMCMRWEADAGKGGKGWKLR